MDLLCSNLWTGSLLITKMNIYTGFHQLVRGRASATNFRYKLQCPVRVLRRSNWCKLYPLPRSRCAWKYSNPRKYSAWTCCFNSIQRILLEPFSRPLSLSHATELELQSSGDPRRRAPQVDDRDSKWRTPPCLVACGCILWFLLLFFLLPSQL